ncbi:MAG: ATP synthase F1 subunit delta [Acidobacteriia bacterium]|nr:ATP synthase F1 subunit delta [Terriglobia bacterium]
MASVAIRYAKALADVVLAKHEVERVRSELQGFSSLLSRSPELVNVMISPAVPVPQKKSLLQALTARAGYSTTTRNFLNILIDHHRINVYEEILAAVHRELDQRLGIQTVEITTATPLDEEQKVILAARLRDLIRKEIQLETQTDPKLIGGVVARIGSTVYDGSIREQLHQLRMQLSGG